MLACEGMIRQMSMVIEAQGLPKMLLTMEEAAQVLSLGRNTIYGLVLRKQIASVKIGRLRRVPLEALQVFVDQQLEQSVGE
jgi:excisionase family DNA binding protein